MYGTQTNSMKDKVDLEFENDVKMYGTQTCSIATRFNIPFENDVKMYGILPICRDLLQKA